MELTLWTYEGPPHVGAMRIAASMEGVHYVLHAPQGDTYADLLFTMIERRDRRPPVTYTTFEARDLGSDTAELFKSAAREAYERFSPQAMIVGASCTAELLQDDPGGLARALNLPCPVIPLELPAFTLVGATTRSGALPGPLRDRFGYTAHLEFYEDAELTAIVNRSAERLHVPLEPAAAALIASRSRGTPRIANRLLRRVRDYTQVHGDGSVSEPLAHAALDLFDVDPAGLDRLDRAVLQALVHTFAGGPVGVSTLAVAVGEEVTTVEEVAEPFLVRRGLVARTPRGRGATAAAYAHLGLPTPGDH